MKLRLRRSVLGNAQFGLAVGLALVSGFGCSDDDSVPDVPMFDGGADAATPVDTDTTGGGGGTTEPDESTTETPTSETSDTDTLVVNPTDTGSSTSTSEPMPTSDVSTTDDPSTDVSSVPTSETSDPTSVPPDTSETMDTASSDTGSSSEEFPNLIANGGFESGSTGWNTWNGTTLTVSTAKARSGQQSLLGSGGTGTGPIATTITPIVNGATYEVTFWASVGTGSASVRIVRSLACADNEYLWVVGNTTVSSTGWTELTGQFTVPDDCDSTSFQVYAEGSAAGVDLYVDDVSVTLLPSDDTSGTDTSGTDTSDMSTDVPDSGTDTMDPSTTGDDVDSGVMDTSEMTEELPDGGVDASSTEPVDTTDDVVTEPDASVTTDVMTSDDVTSTAEETTSAEDGAIDPPVGMTVLANFESGDMGFTSSTLDTEIFSSAESLGMLTASYTQGGGQEAQLAFNITGDYCGMELVARIRLVSGFNESPSAAGGVQLRVWSDNYGEFAGNWTTLTAVGDGNQLGEWVEYRYDMADALASNAELNIGSLNAAGVAFITGGQASDVYTDAVFEIDWIGFESTGLGCP